MIAGSFTAAEAALVSCEICSLLASPASVSEPGYCPRCGEELVWRRHHSIQRTWALVIAAAIGVTGALLVFTALSVIRRHLGKRGLLGFFLSPLPEQANEDP